MGIIFDIAAPIDLYYCKPMGVIVDEILEHDLTDTTIEGRYHDNIESFEVFKVLSSMGVDSYLIIDMISSRNTKSLLMERFSDVIILTSEKLNITIRTILGYICERYIDFDNPPIIRAFSAHLSNELRQMFLRDMARSDHSISLSVFEIGDEMVSIEEED